MSSHNKEVGGRASATVWRKRRRGKRARPTSDHDFHPLVRGTVAAAREHLLSEQDPELGTWCGRVASDPHATAEHLLLLHWLDLAEANSELIESLRAFLINSVNADGAWSSRDDRLDISTSTLCYFALKLSGSSADDQFMENVRASIRARGGAEVVNGLTRFYLSLFGQESYDRCPVMPPEFLLLPRWLPLNATHWSRWARALLVPLSIIWAVRPTRPCDPRADIEELYLNPKARTDGRFDVGHATARKWRARLWRFNARVARSVTRAVERAGIRPFRRPALRSAENWLTERLDEQNGLAGSTTATTLAAIALDALQHPADSIPRTFCLNAIRAAQSVVFAADDEFASDRVAVGVAPSRVAIQDTAIVTQAMAVSGVSPHADELRSGLEWLLQSESTRPGDWQHVVKCDPGGWAREFPSDHYPHITATAQVLQSLREPFANNPASSLVTDDSMVAMIRANSMNLARREIAVLDRVAAASRRARLWLLAMQNPDGGWPCADRHPAKAILYSPRFTGRFPLHDQSTAEATGFVLQALGTWEMGCGQSSVDRGVSFLRDRQLPDGSWESIHAGSHIRATANAIAGLRSVGISWRDMTIDSAARWIVSQQQSDGGWLADANPASSTTCPLQTAWALLALEQAGMGDHQSAHQAVKHLVDRQQVAGHWLSETENPRGGADLVECESDLTSSAIPLLALATWGLANRLAE